MLKIVAAVNETELRLVKRIENFEKKGEKNALKK